LESPRAAARAVDDDRPPFFAIPFKNLGGVTALENAMDLGISTRSHLLRAARFEGCLLVYHFGHDEPPAPSGAEQLIGRAVDGGCDVLALTMPLTRANPKPTVDTDSAQSGFRITTLLLCSTAASYRQFDISSNRSHSG
jgi:hypothetical protein